MDKLQKLLALVKKSGGTCVITDAASPDIFVLLTAEQYESTAVKEAAPTNMRANSLANLSEEGLLDKINKDVAQWKAVNEQEMAEDNQE